MVTAPGTGGPRLEIHHKKELMLASPFLELRTQKIMNRLASEIKVESSPQFDYPQKELIFAPNRLASEIKAATSPRLENPRKELVLAPNHLENVWVRDVVQVRKTY